MTAEAGISQPLLLDLPDRLETRRLTLRLPLPCDGPAVNEAIVETADALRPWMPWATPTPTLDETELWCRKGYADFIARRQLPMLMFLRDDGTFVGSVGIPYLDWSVPRFEIGYWVRGRFEGQGYVTEGVAEVTRFCFETLSARRVEIRMDDRNERSWRVAERLGFALEGVLRNEGRSLNGRLKDTRVYAKTSLNE